jgi:hypothetical protein
LKKLVEYITLGMAAFMDFGMGMTIGAMVSYLGETVIPFWYLAIAGVLAFLPDFDIIPKLLITRTVEDGANHHESLLHRPILMIPAVSILAWLIGGDYWGTVAMLCLAWHYLHDSLLGVGGLQLFWPATDKYLSYRGLHESEFMNHEEWMERYWRVPSYLSVWEVSVGSLALATAVAVQTGQLYLGLTLFQLTFFGAWFIWLMHKRLRSKS